MRSGNSNWPTAKDAVQSDECLQSKDASSCHFLRFISYHEAQLRWKGFRASWELGTLSNEKWTRLDAQNSVMISLNILIYLIKKALIFNIIMHLTFWSIWWCTNLGYLEDKNEGLQQKCRKVRGVSTILNEHWWVNVNIYNSFETQKGVSRTSSRVVSWTKLDALFDKGRGFLGYPKGWNVARQSGNYQITSIEYHSLVL